MTTNIRAWGNSQGLYIPKKILAEAGLRVDDAVNISVVSDGLLIKKDNSRDEKEKAWNSLQSIRKALSSKGPEIALDYKQEVAEYLDEKYGG